MKYMYVVSWYDNGDFYPTITVFNNQESAKKCLSYFEKIHNHICIDKCPIYTHFLVKEI